MTRTMKKFTGFVPVFDSEKEKNRPEFPVFTEDSGRFVLFSV